MLLDKTILIRAPPGLVFDWLAPARQPLWDKSLVRAASRSDGPVRQGSLVERVTRALGFRFASTTEAVVVEEGRLLAWQQVEGDFERNRGAFVLEPAGHGTRLRYVADVELPFVLPRLATEAEVREDLSRAVDDALFNLKALAEARV